MWERRGERVTRLLLKTGALLFKRLSVPGCTAHCSILHIRDSMFILRYFYNTDARIWCSGIKGGWVSHLIPFQNQLTLLHTWVPQTLSCSLVFLAFFLGYFVIKGNLGQFHSIILSATHLPLQRALLSPPHRRERGACPNILTRAGPSLPLSTMSRWWRIRRPLLRLRDRSVWKTRLASKTEEWWPRVGRRVKACSSSSHDGDDGRWQFPTLCSFFYQTDNLPGSTSSTGLDKDKSWWSTLSL